MKKNYFKWLVMMFLFIWANKNYAQMAPFNATGPDYGFGPTTTYGKLNARNDNNTNQTALMVYGEPGTAAGSNQYAITAQANVFGSAPSTTTVNGVYAEAKNGKTNTYGLWALATLNQSGANSSPVVSGVFSEARMSTSYAGGTLNGVQANSYAGVTLSTAYGINTTIFGSGGTMDAAYGSYARVNAATINSGGSAYGSYGWVDGLPSTTGTAYGCFGRVSSSSVGVSYGGYCSAESGTVRYGLYGLATNTSSSSGVTSYGVYGDAPPYTLPGSGFLLTSNNTNSYAGWFNGHVWVNAIFGGSDSRIKRDVATLKDNLGVIKRLKARSYVFEHRAHPSMNLPGGQQIGVIAQELEEVLPQLVITTQVPDQYDHDQKLIEKGYELKGVNYFGLIPVTIGAIQEQQAIIEEQEERIEALIARLDKMDADQTRTDPFAGLTSGAGEGASLFQNEPNPFNENTVIRYQLPQMVGAAMLEVYGANGQLAKRFEGLVGGQGQIMIAAGALKAGAYTYTLVVDGVRTDTKTMVITE